MATPEPMFDMFFLEGFPWVHALDFFRVPHYTNLHRQTESEPFHFRFRQLPDAEGDEAHPENIVVLWANRDEPTTEELLAKAREDLGPDDEDDED